MNKKGSLLVWVSVVSICLGIIVVSFNLYFDHIFQVDYAMMDRIRIKNIQRSTADLFRKNPVTKALEIVKFRLGWGDIDGYNESERMIDEYLFNVEQGNYGNSLKIWLPLIDSPLVMINNNNRYLPLNVNVVVNDYFIRWDDIVFIGSVNNNNHTNNLLECRYRITHRNREFYFTFRIEDVPGNDNEVFITGWEG